MRNTVILCLFSLFGLWAGASQAADPTLVVTDPMARAMPAVAPTSAVFFTLHNNTDRARVLVGAHSTAAKQVELHTHTMQDGMMAMRRVETIDVPAGGTVVFQPGGLHVMLIGLNHALEMGQRIDLTLEFADGGQMKLDVPVGNPGMGGQGMGQHNMHQHMNMQ